MVGYIDARHLKAVKYQNTIRESFRPIFASLAQCLQTLFTQKIAAVFKNVNDCGREAMMELRQSISEVRWLLRIGLTSFLVVVALLQKQLPRFPRQVGPVRQVEGQVGLVRQISAY